MESQTQSLIHTDRLHRVLIVYPNLPMMLTPAVSVGIFTSICKSEGVEVDLFETTPYTDDPSQGMVFKSKLGGGRSWDHGTTLRPTNQMLPDFVEKVMQYKPDLLMVSVVEDCFKDAEMMLKSVSHLNIPHIVGGTFPTNDPEFCLNSPYIDTICTYEGEEVLKDVIRQWPFYKSVKGINDNPKQPLTDLNQFIPDFSLYDPERFYRPMGGRVVRTIQLETYRGCPFSCTFCNSPTTRIINKKYVRQKSLDHVRAEIEYYIKHNDPEYWFIIDDSFTARPRKDLIALCELLGEYNIPWWCNTRIEAVDDELLAAMKNNCCDRIQFGIECGNDEYRSSVLKRNVTNSVYRNKIDTINNCGIPYGLNVIIGMPHETEKMVFETINLIKEFKGYDGLGVSLFIPYRGTQLREYAVKHKLLDESWISENGYLLGGSPLRMPRQYLQPERSWDIANKFKYFCFFDESVWPSIEAGDDLERLYNEQFYSKLALSGADNIKRRSVYACSADPYVEF